MSVTGKLEKELIEKELIDTRKKKCLMTNQKKSLCRPNFINSKG